jgi:hypothetical protein
MSRINTSKVSNVPQDPDNVYLDLIITNLKSSGTPPIPINFNENRNNPVISSSGKYNLSIVRFSLETQTLPVFIPIIAITDPTTGLPNSNRDLTVYSVTLEVLYATTGVTFTQQTFIDWSPQNTLTTPPPPPSQTSNGLQSDGSDYYYCFSFQWWCNLVLQAMAQCFNLLKAQLSAAGLTPTQITNLIGTVPPFIQFNPDNQTCSLALPSPYFNTYDQTVSPPVVNPNAVKLFFNAPLFNLFSSFPAQLTSYTNSLGRTFQILASNFGGSNLITYPTTGSTSAVPPTAFDFLQVFQEYSTIQNWCPVAAIVFTTSTIPVVPNQLSSPLVFAEGNILSNTSGNNSNFQLVLTDLEAGELCYKPNLQYSPTAEYRRLSLTGTSPLSNIQVSVFWRNRLGNLVPFTLGSGGTATVKFLFTKVSAIYGSEDSD